VRHGRYPQPRQHAPHRGHPDPESPSRTEQLALDPPVTPAGSCRANCSISTTSRVSIGGRPPRRGQVYRQRTSRRCQKQQRLRGHHPAHRQRSREQPCQGSDRSIRPARLGAETMPCHATCAYSRMSPPDRSRRRTRTLPGGAGASRPSGGCWARLRCGLWVL
jgi:hypothetical protein